MKGDHKDLKKRAMALLDPDSPNAGYGTSVYFGRVHEAILMAFRSMETMRAQTQDLVGLLDQLILEDKLLGEQQKEQETGEVKADH